MKEHKDIDYPLLFAILWLVIFGSVMISSVSVYDSYRITRKLVESGTLEAPNNWRFIIRNIVQIGIGLAAMVVAIKIPYIWWKKYTKWIATVVIAMLIWVLIFGIKINGARWWFDIPWLPFALQPTEFLKLSIILTVASFCARYKHSLADTQQGFIPFIVSIIIPVILVFLQPDLWALFIIIPIAVSIFFIAGGNIRILTVLLGVGIVIASLFYVLGSYSTPEERTKFSYIHDRVNSFFAGNKNSIENNTMHHQNKQALIAIGSGGFLGLWFGNSIQKFWYLPEPQGDFVFSVITEELWFIGSFVLIMVYLFIAYRGFLIVLACEDDFGKYVAFGIVVWITWQMIVNVSVNMSIFPNTGLTLPFVSYGGSSLLSTLTAAGILLSISREKSGKQYISNFLPHIFWRGRAQSPRKNVLSNISPFV